MAAGWDVTDAEVEELRVRVRRTLYRYRDHEDYEDIAQEAWLLSCHEWPKLRGRCPIQAMVKICGRSAFSRWVRSRRARQIWRPPSEAPPPMITYLAEMPHSRWMEARDPCLVALDRIQKEEEAARALAAMTPRQAELVRRTVMADESYAKAGARLGIAKGTVGVLLMRGLKRGRRALEGVDGA